MAIAAGAEVGVLAERPTEAVVGVLGVLGVALLPKGLSIV